MLRNFRLNIIFRVLLLTGVLAAFVYLIFVAHNYLRSMYILVLLSLLIAELIWYVERTNRDFTSFLTSLLQDDFTTTFSDKNKGASFRNMYQTFNAITRKFKKISFEKQAQYIYLETLVEHVNVGIISFDQNERVHLMNNAMKGLLGKTSFLYLKSLETVNNELLHTLRNIAPGDQKLLNVKINNNLLQLAIYASAFKIEDKTYKLISLQNIKNELENNELDAWKKLIRVLTHEIMNSVTPISSLTDTLVQMVQTDRKDQPDTQVLSKVSQGLEAIKSRSEGLQSFTEAYKTLTRIPTPSFVEVDLPKLLERVQLLLAHELDNINITIAHSDRKIKAIADPALLEQVIINILKNAKEAMVQTPEPSISISVHRQERIVIMITDNGPGIEQEKMDKIFIPFFTTKSNGSGIGLALSREIMRLHNGSIYVKSQEGAGTTFTLTI
ncbi:GHKL domain-containing protein [Fulvivirga sp. RKSG066]|uniref:sensor histidine kinase n=1 Tax=Fulvivirga aurantia TaxID=2529383 RepID=UPI0012BC8867|nr:ATP-binding protein [Fulvivirga aurantia]MTI21871.1 GHKL domain-containing protein [Fulvivirga aurantia]